MPEEPSDNYSEVEELIAGGDYKLLASFLMRWAVPDVAELILQSSKPNQVLIYRALPRDRAADVFAYMQPEDQDTILRALSDSDTRSLLADLSPDDRTAVFEELPAKVTRRLMQLLSPSDLVEVRQLLGYPPESVGRLMTPDYIRIYEDWTCEQALAHIRKYGRDSEILNILYVTDKKGKLIDIVRMLRLIMAEPGTVIKDMLNYNFVSVSAYEDREVAVEMIQRYDINALPVLDSEGVLLGIVTVDDILDVAEEEVTEDIQKGAAMVPLETRYSVATPFHLFRKRIGWLLVLIFVGLISAKVISHYEDYIVEFITLALFMPLVIASGGNCGAQSATLMVRAIATSDLGLDDWMAAITKELVVGILLGVVMALIAAGVGQLYGGDVKLALIVGLSTVAIVFVANTFGALLPFALSRMNIDPATASSPLITSIMDVLGLIIYFSIAVLILG